MSELEQVRAVVESRPPDFRGRNGAPIWCVGEPTIAEIRDLLRREGALTPSPEMEALLRKAMGR